MQQQSSSQSPEPATEALALRGHAIARDVSRHVERIREEIRSGAPKPSRRQGIFWMLTVPHQGFTPWLPPGCRWIKGQLEMGQGGFLHWQIVVALRLKGSIKTVRGIFGPYHAELTKSAAANEYVWKELTRIEATSFEIGQKPCDPKEPTDWYFP